MTVAQGGGVFISRTLTPESAETVALKTLNEQVVSGLGMWRGVTHAEYIKANADGRIYFLEIAARVGGAHISDLVEAATGINLWAEWARIEIATVRNESYQLPKTRQQFGGLLVCLAQQEHPDLSAYNDPEVMWKLDKK